jgi:hypothetical protein
VTRSAILTTPLYMILGLFVAPAFANGGLVTDDPRTLSGSTKERPYSPYAGRKFPARPLWGDTHLHTAISFDAGAFGSRLLPADAYRFAKGEEVTASSGQPARMSRPLDFLVVSDHSDNMGLFPELQAGTPFVKASETGRRWHAMIWEGGQKPPRK